MTGKTFYLGYGITSVVIITAFFLFLHLSHHADPEYRKEGGTHSDAGFTRAMYESLAAIADTMPPPAPGEWLYEMEENGQPFDEFITQQWPRPDKRFTTLYLLPIDVFEKNNAPDITFLARFARAYFMMPVTVLPAMTIDTTKIRHRQNPFTHNTQVLTTDILDLISMKIPHDGFCLAAVTAHDLYPEESWNFVFGQASLTRRIGVFSFARYDPAFLGERHSLTPQERRTLILRRSCKILAHEIGHMFGLYHCIYHPCEMNGSNNLKESDAKPIHLCPVCLRKIHHSIGFNAIERYEKLHTVYHDAGFTDYAEDVARFLAAVRNNGLGARED